MIALDAARVRDALAPLRAELLRRAADDAEATLAQAHTETRALLEAAEREAAAILQDARDAGAADAATAQAADRARGRRAHQAAILAAQRNAYEQLGSRAAEAVRALRDEPGYPALRTRLAARAREILGADAVISEDPAGGIVAQAAGRRLDLNLTAFAARALERVEGGVDGLWS